MCAGVLRARLVAPTVTRRFLSRFERYSDAAKCILVSKCLGILPGCTNPCRMCRGNKETCLFPPKIITCNPKTQWKSQEISTGCKNASLWRVMKTTLLHATVLSTSMIKTRDVDKKNQRQKGNQHASRTSRKSWVLVCKLE